MRCLRTSWLMLCWVLLAGTQASMAQAPDPLQAGPSPSQEWKSCAAGLADQRELAKSLDAQVTRPQDVSQLLENLRLAWQNDWLLRPDFYDAETLSKFFNSVTITWKQTQDTRSPAEEIAMETRSGIFPQLSIVLQAHCRAGTFPRPDGRTETIVTMGGNFHMNSLSGLGTTLSAVRQVLGPETLNELDPDYLGASEVPHPITIRGSVVYTDLAKESREGWRMGLTFYFGIPPKVLESVGKKIGPDEVVQWIVLSVSRHQTTEN
jgi:hypothetical protein